MHGPDNCLAGSGMPIRRLTQLPGPGTGLRQLGQSTVEALVALAVLAGMVAAIAWLGRLQDISLQMGHVSRHAAFGFAHQGLAHADLATGTQAQMQAPGRHWHTRQGKSMLQGDLLLQVDSSSLAPARQAGDPVSKASAMRSELQLGDAAVWQVQVRVRTAGQAVTGNKLHDFDQLALGLARHTAIMRGSGAASSDHAAQSILGNSRHVWKSQADQTMQTGQGITARLADIDAAWGRPGISWDWLNPWTGWVPQNHLNVRRQP